MGVDLMRACQGSVWGFQGGEAPLVGVYGGETPIMVLEAHKAHFMNDDN